MRTIKLFLFILVGFSAGAQEHPQQIYLSDSQEMVLLLNDEIIGSIDFLRTLPSEEIKAMSIHREEKLSAKENLFYRSNNESGLIKAKIDFEVDVKTQEDLNEFFGLPANNDLYVNGYFLENRNYKISSHSIAKVEIIEPDNVLVDKRVLNVTIK